MVKASLPDMQFGDKPYIPEALDFQRRITYTNGELHNCELGFPWKQLRTQRPVHFGHHKDSSELKLPELLST